MDNPSTSSTNHISVAFSTHSLSGRMELSGYFSASDCTGFCSSCPDCTSGYGLYSGVISVSQTSYSPSTTIQVLLCSYRSLHTGLMGRNRTGAVATLQEAVFPLHHQECAGCRNRTDSSNLEDSCVATTPIPHFPSSRSGLTAFRHLGTCSTSWIRTKTFRLNRTTGYLYTKVESIVSLLRSSRASSEPNQACPRPMDFLLSSPSSPRAPLLGP